MVLADEIEISEHMTTKQAAKSAIEPNWENKTLFLGDNLHIMRRMNSSLMDLIYLDPPFNSHRKYKAPIGANREITEIFNDIWREEDLDQLEHALLAQYTAEELPLFSQARYKGFNPLYSAITASRATHGKWMFTYLIMMSMRLIEMRRLLKETGSIYLHCDPYASHYLKMVMDAIFGKENFRREIVWAMPRPSGFKTQAQNWIRGHDTILYYTKTPGRQIFNKQYEPYNAEYLKHFKKSDEQGPYWKRDGKKRRLRKGFNLHDTWSDIQPLQTQSVSKEEGTGWPTQKPLKLLERIIKSSSNQGDIVFDPFCGCATACVASEKLGREWIGIDIAEQARVEIKKRMIKLAIDRGNKELAIWKGIHIRDLQKSVASLWRDELGKLPHPRTHKNALYGKQEGRCAACGGHQEIRNLEVDHIVPKAKGGTDHISNLQLLCPGCNRMKGDRPQAYLDAELKRLGIVLN